MKLKLNWLVVLIVGLIVGGMVGVLATTGLQFQQEALLQKEVAPQLAVSREDIAGETASESLKDETGSVAKPSDSLIIKTKHISLEIKDLKETYTKVENIALKHNGFIVSSSISSNGPVTSSRLMEKTAQNETGPLSGMIVLKVPADNFKDTVKELKTLGNLKSEQESSEEVTEQHIDLSARLKNLKRQEERYLEILNSAKTVEDMLKVEEQLSRIRGGIESMQAQVDYLERSAAMATITLELFEPSAITEPIVNWGIRDSLIRAIRNFVAVINLVIVSVGTILPLAIAALLAWLIVVLWRRRKK